MTNKYKEIEKIKFEYDQLTEEFIAELDDKTVMTIMGGNRGKWAQLFNAKEAPADVEPDFYVSKRTYDLAMTNASGIGIKGISREKLLPDDVACYTQPPADVEPVAWRWYNKHTFASVLGNYKPEDDTFPDSAIDIEPLYTQPPADKEAERFKFLTTIVRFEEERDMGKGGRYWLALTLNDRNANGKQITFSEAIDKAMGEVNHGN